MQSIARDSFDYLNKIRQNPKVAVEPLEEKLKYFKDKVLNMPGQVALKTQEGPEAVQECITFLKSQKPLPVLAWNDGLTKAAQDHAKDLGPKGNTGHTGSDGSSMTQRIERYGEWMGHIGENISFGQKTGQDVVLQLIVDDGVKTRGHRKNCFNPDFKLVGISSQDHTKYKTLCVMDFAEEFTIIAGGAGQKAAQPKKQQQNMLGGGAKKNPQIMDEDDDPNRPKNAVGCSTKTETVITNGKKRVKITKTYKMKDGSTQIQIEERIEG